MKNPITLKCGERIVAAVPEFCGGPGWSNTPVWVHIVAKDGTYRQECLQPDQQTPSMRQVFRICNEAHRLMLDEIEALTKRAKGDDQ